jgi:hypothetical protein
MKGFRRRGDRTDAQPSWAVTPGGTAITTRESDNPSSAEDQELNEETAAMCTSPVKPRPDRSPGDRSTRHSPRCGGFRSAVFTVISMLILAGFTLAPRAVHADITYTIDNYASLQEGYTVSGTITTNGTTGPFIRPGGGVVKSWDIAITQGTTTIFTFTHSNSSFAGSTFDATLTNLSIAAGDTIYLRSSNPSLYDIQWLNLAPSEVYQADTPQTILWTGRGWNPESPVATASVPEPSSAILAAIGAVSGIAYGWVRKRREHRR